MSRTFAVGAVAACAALITSPVASADRVEPVPVYGFYDVHVDFAKQTFNGMPTPMESKAFPVEFSTHCDVDGCVMRMDNSGDQVRNPSAPLEYEYHWNNGRWETSGEQPYLCERTDPDSGVPSQRSDYWIPNSAGSFRGERTLVVGGAGCPGEGPGTHSVPISMTPIGPPR
ncbi:hypothetical protein CIW52_34065 [Mycolicibacterium sp. P9-64]|uniref:hypothetical protein n=1 Tax=Mycolicibacterium sp. P9-64 TaxID=2024612 RepID=UPI0011EFEE9A|nr:hypothetical protein [Mycolicibacterium sp. P9-64]KAA0074802.1 hypothetical protein CIW52_34065 [Mycolicibacterium sp. P9-64]